LECQEILWSFGQRISKGCGLEEDRSEPISKRKEAETARKATAYFSKEQLGLLLKSIEDPDFRELVLFAVMTGMRMSEILNLQWEEVDLERKIILVKNTSTFTTKSKRNRSVPMSDSLAVILMRRKQSASCPLCFIVTISRTPLIM
jgi:integrase